MECMRQYISELLDFIADMHTLTKLKVSLVLIICRVFFSHILPVVQPYILLLFRAI